MKKRKKVLHIELLVVVAIIGTLAAVGVVAYNGYTAAAKENSSKAIHANAVKYVASELAKCNMDDSSEIFGGAGSVNCDSTARHCHDVNRFKYTNVRQKSILDK